jgi:hypothetical protein
VQFASILYGEEHDYASVYKEYRRCAEALGFIAVPGEAFDG